MIAAVMVGQKLCVHKRLMTELANEAFFHHAPRLSQFPLHHMEEHFVRQAVMLDEIIDVPRHERTLGTLGRSGRELSKQLFAKVVEKMSRLVAQFVHAIGKVLAAQFASRLDALDVDHGRDGQRGEVSQFFQEGSVRRAVLLLLFLLSHKINVAGRRSHLRELDLKHAKGKKSLEQIVISKNLIWARKHAKQDKNNNKSTGRYAKNCREGLI